MMQWMNLLGTLEITENSRNRLEDAAVVDVGPQVDSHSVPSEKTTRAWKFSSGTTARTQTT